MTAKITKTFLFLFFLASIEAKAAKHIIEVGPGGQNVFNPSAIPNVIVGDVIRWEWKAGNHTTTSAVVPTGAAAWNSPITSTVTFFEYTVTVAGNYGYVCTPHVSMNMVGGFTASAAAGVDEPSKASFHLFPNPATDAINLFFAAPIQKNTVVTIYDIQGKVITTEKADRIIGSNKMSIPFAFQPAGVYFVRVKEENNNYTLRLLKR